MKTLRQFTFQSQVSMNFLHMHTFNNYMFCLNLNLLLFLEDIHPSEHLAEDPATSTEGENFNNGAEVYHPQETKEDVSVIDEEVVVPITSENDIVTIHDSTPAVQDDEQKTSYASIVSLSLYILLHLRYSSGL